MTNLKIKLSLLQLRNFHFNLLVSQKFPPSKRNSGLSIENSEEIWIRSNFFYEKTWTVNYTRIRQACKINFIKKQKIQKTRKKNNTSSQTNFEGPWVVLQSVLTIFAFIMFIDFIYFFLHHSMYAKHQSFIKKTIF